ncbi:MAG TPA: hypothetical protein VG095_05830 [Chthoniobacterales bacterium]|nr:hypothetical protein [Chthoniobacterales bacterium]
MKGLRFTLLHFCKLPRLTLVAFVAFSVGVAVSANTCGQQVNAADLSISLLVSIILAGAAALTCNIPAPGNSPRMRE